MPALPKKLFIFGLSLTLLGCFLPWQVEGDFLFRVTYGIRIFPTLEDNGGFLIAFLCILLLLLLFWPPKIIERPSRWVIVLTTSIALLSIFHIGSWILDYSDKIGVVGAPAIRIGLVMVFLGSVILLSTSIWQFRKILN